MRLYACWKSEESFAAIWAGGSADGGDGVDDLRIRRAGTDGESNASADEGERCVEDNLLVCGEFGDGDGSGG